MYLRCYKTCRGSRVWPTGYILGISCDYVTSTALLGSGTLHSTAHFLNLFFLSKVGSLRLPSSTFFLFFFLHINDGYSRPTHHSVIWGQLQPGVALYELSCRLSDVLSPLGCRRSHCRHRSWRRRCNGRTRGRLLPSRYMIGRCVRRAKVSRGWIPPSWFQRYRSVLVLLAGQLSHCH